MSDISRRWPESATETTVGNLSTRKTEVDDACCFSQAVVDKLEKSYSTGISSVADAHECAHSRVASLVQHNAATTIRTARLKSPERYDMVISMQTSRVSVQSSSPPRTHRHAVVHTGRPKTLQRAWLSRRYKIEGRFYQFVMLWCGCMWVLGASLTHPPAVTGSSWASLRTKTKPSHPNLGSTQQRTSFRVRARWVGRRSRQEE